MPADPEILAARIREAIRAAGLSQHALAERVGMDPTALSKVLSGKRRLSSFELALIAQETSVAVDDLVGTSPTIGGTLAARVQRNAVPAVDEALRRVNELLDIDALLCQLGLSAPASRLPVQVPGKRNLHQHGDELARQVRQIASYGDGYIEELASFCEQFLGVDIAVENLPPGLDGLAVARGNYRLVLISSAIPATRQRYTLAHEIGHLAAGDTDDILIDESLFGSSNAEVRANAFAAAFLMPETSLLKAMGTAGIVESAIGDMLANFKVSVDALAWRLYNLKLVDGVGRERVRRLSSRKLSLLAGHAAEYQRQLQDHGNRRLPGGLLQRAVEAYEKGDIGIRVLGRLTHVPVELLSAQLDPLPPIVDSAAADSGRELVL